MLTLAAKPLGFHVIVVDPNPNSPAAQVGAEEITAAYNDAEATKKLAKRSDWLTIEIEHIDVGTLEKLEAAGKAVNPAPATVRMIQDKLAQKKFLKSHGIPIADFTEITSLAQATRILDEYGGKMLVKTRHGAFDGRGNAVVTDIDELHAAMKAFDGKKLYAERYVPFIKELAVMVARDVQGNVVTYPVVETFHERNICVEVIAPAPVEAAIQEKAAAVAKKVTGHLKGAGVFGIELFLTAEGRILVNEIAPRVHNSGHYTLDASHTSQFEQHVRAITGLPLGDTSLLVPAAVMINILGERNGETRVTGLGAAVALPQTHVHLYGKSPTKVDRKMGHITSKAATVEKAKQNAKKARKHIDV